MTAPPVFNKQCAAGYGSTLFVKVEPVDSFAGYWSIGSVALSTISLSRTITHTFNAGITAPPATFANDVTWTLYDI